MSVNEKHTKYADAVEWCTISFAKKLPTGVLLTGTPILTDCKEKLYFSNIKINDDTLVVSPNTEHEETIASGQAVQFLVASGEAGVEYDMKAVCGTTSDVAPAQTLVQIAPLKIIRE